MRGLIAALLLAATGATAEDVRIAVEPNFPPFIALDAAGDLTGFDKAIGDEICARAALSCTWVVTEFDDLIAGVAAGKFDLAMSGLGNSTGRLELVDFTDIYLPSMNPAAYVGFLNAPPPPQARIGVQTGTIHEEHLAERGLPYTGFDSAADALDAVRSREVDLVFGSSSYFQSILPTRYPSLRMQGFVNVGVDGTAIAITKGRDELRVKLNDTIDGMRRDGTIAALVAVWFAPSGEL